MTNRSVPLLSVVGTIVAIVVYLGLHQRTELPMIVSVIAAIGAATASAMVLVFLEGAISSFKEDESE